MRVVSVVQRSYIVLAITAGSNIRKSLKSLSLILFQHLLCRLQARVLDRLVEVQ